MTTLRTLTVSLCGWAAATAALAATPVYYDVIAGAGPHDVAAAPVAGGVVYYTAQATGKLGILNPATGKVEEIALGPRRLGGQRRKAEYHGQGHGYRSIHRSHASPHRPGL